MILQFLSFSQLVDEANRLAAEGAAVGDNDNRSVELDSSLDEAGMLLIQFVYLVDFNKAVVHPFSSDQSCQ